MPCSNLAAICVLSGGLRSKVCVIPAKARLGPEPGTKAWARVLHLPPMRQHVGKSRPGFDPGRGWGHFADMTHNISRQSVERKLLAPGVKSRFAPPHVPSPIATNACQAMRLQIGQR